MCNLKMSKEKILLNSYFDTKNKNEYQFQKRSVINFLNFHKYFTMCFLNVEHFV